MHFDVVDYNRPAPSFTATVKDFYEQDVLTESRNFVQLSVPENIVRDCKGFSAFVGGEIVQYFERGQVNFSDVDAFCAPGGFMSLNASTALVSTAATFQFSFRECVRGGNNNNKLVLISHAMPAHHVHRRVVESRTLIIRCDLTLLMVLFSFLRACRVLCGSPV